jgi:hypothetical protein
MVVGGFAVIAVFFGLAVLTGRRDSADNDARWAELTGAGEPARPDPSRPRLGAEMTASTGQRPRNASGALAAALPRALRPQRLPGNEFSLSGRSWPNLVRDQPRNVRGS